MIGQIFVPKPICPLEYGPKTAPFFVTMVVKGRNGGFNDSKHFVRVAKKRFGCTPSDLELYGK